MGARQRDGVSIQRSRGCVRNAAALSLSRGKCVCAAKIFDDWLAVRVLHALVKFLHEDVFVDVGVYWEEDGVCVGRGCISS